MAENTDVATTNAPGAEVAPVTKRSLPTLEELNLDPEEAFKKDQFNLLVNQPPKQSWVKQHPTVKKEVMGPNGVKIKVPSEYIPIDTIELLLTRIFQDWYPEVLREGVMFQSVYCAVRLHLTHPVTGKPMFYDGVGAVGVQTDAGKPASDLAAIKAAAIQMALPAAKSYAIKDAAEHIGKLFGKDLNRKDAIAFSMTYGQETKTTVDILEKKETEKEEERIWDIPQAILDSLEGAKTKKEVNSIYLSTAEDIRNADLKEFVKLRFAEIDVEKMKTNAEGQPK